MAKTVFDVLIDKLSERVISANEFLADGGCKDYAHYRNVCGVVQGLNTAIFEIKDLSLKYHMDDDND